MTERKISDLLVADDKKGEVAATAKYRPLLTTNSLNYKPITAMYSTQPFGVMAVVSDQTAGNELIDALYECLDGFIPMMGEKVVQLVFEGEAVNRYHKHYVENIEGRLVIGGLSVPVQECSYTQDIYDAMKKHNVNLVGYLIDRELNVSMAYGRDGFQEFFTIDDVNTIKERVAFIRSNEQEQEV